MHRIHNLINKTFFNSNVFYYHHSHIHNKKNRFK